MWRHCNDQNHVGIEEPYYSTEADRFWLIANTVSVRTQTNPTHGRVTPIIRKSLGKWFAVKIIILMHNIMLWSVLFIPRSWNVVSMEIEPCDVYVHM